MTGYCDKVTGSRDKASRTLGVCAWIPETRGFSAGLSLARPAHKEEIGLSQESRMTDLCTVLAVGIFTFVLSHWEGGLGFLSMNYEQIANH